MRSRIRRLRIGIGGCCAISGPLLFKAKLAPIALRCRRTVMATFRSTPDLAMHYEVDDFTYPWRASETILLLHGNAESGPAWYGWAPPHPPRSRAVRADTRGRGASTASPPRLPCVVELI